MMANPDLPRLDYAQAPAWNRRRVQRWLVRGALVLLAGALAWWGWRLWPQVQLLCWQYQCMTYEAPPDQVVYDENLDTAATLRKDANHYTSWNSGAPDSPQLFACRELPEWRRLEGRLYDLLRPTLSPEIFLFRDDPDAFIFMHGRTTKKGRERLVVLSYGSWEAYPVERGFQYRPPWFHLSMVKSGGLRRDPELNTDFPGGWLPGLSDQHVRMFAGQPDLNDASHFTIHYEINGESGTIDGWLEDREDNGRVGYASVRLDIRDGPALLDQELRPDFHIVCRAPATLPARARSPILLPSAWPPRISDFQIGFTPHGNTMVSMELGEEGGRRFLVIRGAGSLTISNSNGGDQNQHLYLLSCYFYGSGGLLGARQDLHVTGDSIPSRQILDFDCVPAGTHDILIDFRTYLVDWTQLEWHRPHAFMRFTSPPFERWFSNEVTLDQFDTDLATWMRQSNLRYREGFSSTTRLTLNPSTTRPGANR